MRRLLNKLKKLIERVGNIILLYFGSPLRFMYWRMNPKRIPDLLYLWIANLYMHLHPYRKNVLLTRNDDSWLARYGDLKLQVPKEKGACIPGLDSRYERYFEVEEGDYVLDIGACIGGFSVPVARKAKRVVAIEPSPNNYFYLRKNTLGLANIKTVEKAVWKEKRIMKLRFGNHIGSHSLLDLGSKGVRVQADTLDTIVSELGLEKIDLIKMDVEGSEIEALKGARKTLRMTEKIVVAAYHSREGEPRTSDRVAKLLKKNGFKIKISPEGLVYGWKK